MGFFKLLGRKNQPKEEPKPQEEAAPATPRVVQTKDLTTGRMANLYKKLYQWIFSVNASMNVYQIESGSDTFSDEPLAVRGYYNQLLERLQKEVLRDSRDEFLRLFSVESIKRMVKNQRTCISGVFCSNELGVETAEDEARKHKWYEYRVQWQEDVDPNNIICVLSIRKLTNDLDVGLMNQGQRAVSLSQEEDIDWDAIRIRSLYTASTGMSYEYQVDTDTFYLHRLPGNSAGDRETVDFLTTLSAKADHFISHEYVDVLRNALRATVGRGVETAEILYRRDGVFGAPFEHYKLTSAPVEENGVITWIVGDLHNVEAETREKERSNEIAAEVNNMFKLLNITMYQINATQGLIFRIAQDATGFHREEKPQRLQEYLQRRIATGSIHSEDREKYTKWLENGFLQRKTAQGAYEFESRIMEAGRTDYSWYSETIMAIAGKPGQFVRWRREANEAHKAKEDEYQIIERAHIAEYNSQMLDTMASLVEFRNAESTDHIKHVNAITRILMEDLKKRSPNYEITHAQIELYTRASSMHDIGKITVPDYILNKKGRFTPEEFEIMTRHTTDGALIVERLNMPGQDELKNCIHDVVLHHHERFDGKGYPDKLEGEKIAIGVQVVGLADVCDALVSERCYKKGYDFNEAINMILNGECGVFNPRLLESLKACTKELQSVFEG